MAEEVKETMEQFETQLEESLNKAATNEDAVWNHLEELKESGEVLAQAIAAHDPLRAQDAMYLHLVYNRKVISTSTI